MHGNPLLRTSESIEQLHEKHNSFESKNFFRYGDLDMAMDYS